MCSSLAKEKNSRMITTLLVARIGVYSTDLGIYITAAIYFGIMQTLVWGIARHSADIEFWRTGAFCLLVGSMTLLGLAVGGVGGLATAAILGWVCGWVILGYVFDLENWQRQVMTLVGPIAAALSYVGGYWLKSLFYSGVTG
jgi:hypothetical protein